MPLPGEARVKRTIAANLSAELAYCSRLLSFGVDLPNPGVINHRPLEADTLTAAMGLYSKACLSYKGIIHLCEVGLDRTAAPVNRSLFETLLNLTFLLRRRVSLHQFDFAAKRKTPLDLFGKRLDTAFRTALYCAFCTLRHEKMVAQWPKTPGLKRTGKAAHKILSVPARPYVTALGPKWEKRLKKANTCTGLSIADYARSLGTSYYVLYRSVYAMDSQSVHQSDSLSYLEIDDAVTSISPRWYTSPDQVRGTLRMACLVFVGCMEALNKRLRFGRDVIHRVGEFVDELDRWPP